MMARSEMRGAISDMIGFSTKIRKVERRSKRQFDSAGTEYLRHSQRYEKIACGENRWPASAGTESPGPGLRYAIRRPPLARIVAAGPESWRRIVRLRKIPLYEAGRSGIGLRFDDPAASVFGRFFVSLSSHGADRHLQALPPLGRNRHPCKVPKGEKGGETGR